MSILLMMALSRQLPSSCVGAPTVNSISKDVDVLGTCLGDGWHTEWSIDVTGSLKFGQEYYWEVADNAAGDNWQYQQRGGTTMVYNHIIGTDGPGLSTQKWIKVRCGVVPAGGDSNDYCNSVDSAQATRTALSCVT